VAIRKGSVESVLSSVAHEAYRVYNIAFTAPVITNEYGDGAEGDFGRLDALEVVYL
jgi:hypothetical protein